MTHGAGEAVVEAPSVEASPSSTPAVVVDGLSKEFRIPTRRVSTLKERALHPLRKSGHTVLRALSDVSFDVGGGEFFGIVGRNGCGKSTLLKCMAGIYRADRGTVRVRGRLAPFIELGVGFNPELTARDNVTISSVMLGLHPDEARARFERVIAFAELERFLDLAVKNYSSGMHVRLAFAVLTQVDADVILVDEVLAVGDASFQQKCFDKFEELKEARKTLLMVTHDMGNVERFCDRAMLIEQGEVVEIGEPERIARLYDEVNFGGAHVLPKLGDAGGEPVELPERRTGDGSARIVGAWFEDRHGRRATSLVQGMECAFRAEIEFLEPAVDPIFGLWIETASEARVFATTTRWAGVRTGRFDPMERATFTVRFENVLALGKYLATPLVVRDEDGKEFMDLRRGLVPIESLTSKVTSGLVDFAHDVEVSRTGPARGDH